MNRKENGQEKELKEQKVISLEKMYDTSQTKERSVKENKKETADYIIIALVVFFILVIGYMAVQYVEQGMTLKRLEMQKNQLQGQIDEKNKEIEGLRQEIENSKTPEYMEKQAREQLKMVKPNERVYIDLERKN